MKSFLAFIIILVSVQILPAQRPDSIKIAVPPDSNMATMVLLRDSLKTDSVKRVEEKISNASFDQLWLNFQLNGGIDKYPIEQIYHQFEDLITTNYTGLADVFRDQP